MGKTNELNFSQWEQFIRSGNGRIVRDAITRIHSSELSRSEVVKVANFARRVGLSQLAIKLLRNNVRPPDGIKSQATPEEKAEYAGALIREGIVSEGLSILDTVSGQSYPESLLYSGFGLFTRWDYVASVPLLRQYVGLANSEYQKILGQINLVAALLFTEELKEAESILKELLLKTKTEQYRLSHSYCLELSGQCQLQLKNFKKAREYFQLAGRGAKDSSTSTPFLARKWLAILDLIEASDSKKKSAEIDSAIISLGKIKKEAQSISDFETVRTCDLNLAIATKNSELSQFVYFGSPHLQFRLNVKHKVEKFAQLPERFTRYYGMSEGEIVNKKLVRVFDMFEAREGSSEVQLKPGQVMHRLFSVISADFYRPIRATELFSLIFPNEYFDQVVSINRVHQAIKRLRIWLDQNEVPLEFVEDKNTYFTKGKQPYAVLWLDRDFSYGKKPAISRLHQHFSQNSFSVQQAAKFLTLPERSTSRLIKDAVEKGELQKIGAGPHTRYRKAE